MWCLFGILDLIGWQYYPNLASLGEIDVQVYFDIFPKKYFGANQYNDTMFPQNIPQVRC